MNGAEPTCQQQCRLLLKQVGLEMMLEGAQSHIWCSKIGWQTVPCPWSIDSEAVLTGTVAVRARGTSRVPDAVEWSCWQPCMEWASTHRSAKIARGCIM